MAFKIFDPKNGFSLNQHFRERRFKHFITLLNKLSKESNQPIQILDIGGTESYWERMNFTENNKVIVTLLNLDEVVTKNKNFISVSGDACNMPQYSDKQFDIVFSNSVIEHLFSYENQKKMADEVMRVGKNYYVQTPNYYFPLEPHWLFPFFQFLPYKLKVYLTLNFNLGHYKKSKTKEDAIKRVDEVKLLTVSQMRQLFPNGNIFKERLFGLVKSITMYNFP